MAAIVVVQCLPQLVDGMEATVAAAKMSHLVLYRTENVLEEEFCIGPIWQNLGWALLHQKLEGVIISFIFWKQVVIPPIFLLKGINDHQDFYQKQIDKETLNLVAIITTMNKTFDLIKEEWANENTRDWLNKKIVKVLVLSNIMHSDSRRLYVLEM
ncbi:hypothetical protein ACJX0J_007909, partial [Zea mays]